MGREVQSERTRIIDWNIHSVVCEGFVCFVGCFGFLRVWGFFNLSNRVINVFFIIQKIPGVRNKYFCL